MPLHPQVRAMREQRKRDRTPQLYTLTIEQARAADLASIQGASGALEAVSQVDNRYFIGPSGARLPIRVYRPVNDASLPVLVYFFGGGWTLGTIDTADAVCRSLANAARCLVVSVGYRLAPEHRFPAAVLDCEAATRWVAKRARDLGADRNRIAVGGDSAGGNLAAVVAQLCRQDGGPALVGQLLVYPNTDYAADTPSRRDNVDPYLFNRTSVAWYWDHYLGSARDGRDPRASPLRAADLSGLPAALVITAEYDPLRDEAEEYGRRMVAAGVDVTVSRYPGMVHGFFCMAGELDDGRLAHAEAAKSLRRWFGN